MAKFFTSDPAAGDAPNVAVVASWSRNLHWCRALPTLSSAALMLREPVAGDALALLTALSSEALGQLVADPPPATQAGFEGFIATMQTARHEGREACWAIVPRDTSAAVGLMRVRALDYDFTTIDGTAALAEEFRGTHVFQDAARLVLGCLFRTMGVQRAEFRIDVRNSRANGALRKLGATQEGLLRRALRRDGGFHDQVLWAMVAIEWASPRDLSHRRIH